MLWRMSLMTHLPNFADTRIIVVGDVMLDRYWAGAAQRISPEAPVPVVRVQHDDARPGGGGNVALNLAKLGCQVTCAGVIGADESGRLLQSRLQAAGVQAELLDTAPETITKLRVLSRNQQLVRLDFEPDAEAFQQAALSPAVSKTLHTANVDVLVLSDYAKGALDDPQQLIQTAKQLNIPVLVDPKGDDFARYTGATLLTPNLGEFEAIVGRCDTTEALVIKGQSLVNELDLKALLVTRSEKGMTLLRRDAAAVHLPTQAQEVADVTGAGDTVIATLAAAVAAGLDWPDAARMANAAAGLVVAKSGAAQVASAELQQALALPGAYSSKIKTETELLDQVALHAKRWVMTNGCFDVLHPGHVAYLEQARALGDGLIVAVNEDASVQRLKGENRPINKLAARMRVLAGLAAVDAVVSFSEDTPERLIASVLPDILVKGGDYRPEDIAGGQAVIANGGQVQVLSFVDGYSTTQTIQKIQQQD